MRRIEAPGAKVEVTGWVTRFVGGDGSGRYLYDMPLEPGETLRDVLKRLSARYPELDQALWDDESKLELGEHIEVLVNDAVLGITHTLDSRLAPGDSIILVGQYMGG